MEDDGSGEGLLADRRVEIRVRKNGRKDKVIVEKSAAEGLPEGWIKELVITKRKGQRNRRDPYFIDPKSGYVFQSFKDASRYVRTGVLGKHARKPKENSTDEDDSASAKSLSPTGSVEKETPESVLVKEKKFNIYVRHCKRKSLSSLDEKSENCKVSLKPSSQVPEVEPGKKEEAKDPTERKLIYCSESDITTTPDDHTVEKRVTRSQAKGEENDSNCKPKRKSLSLLDENSENCKLSSKPSSIISQVLEEEPSTKEESKDSSRRKHISCSGNDNTATQDEKPVIKRVTRSQVKEKKDEDNKELKRKSRPNKILPRRASKRLAGIEVEQMPELKTSSTQQEPAVEQFHDAVAIKRKESSFEFNPPLVNCRRAELPLSQGVAEKYEGQSSSKLNLPLNNDEEMPPVSEKIEAVDKKSEAQSGKKLNAAKKKEMRVVSLCTHQTVVKKLDEAAVAKSERGSSPKPVTSLGRFKQMEKYQPIMLSFQNVVAMSNETVGRVSWGSTQPMPNTFLNSDLCVDNNAIQMGNGVQKDVAPILSAGNLPVVKGASSVLTEIKANNVSEPRAFDSTLADLWKDPCIAFAIKTLTGESLDPLTTEPTNVTTGVNIHDEQRGVTVSSEMSKDSNKGNLNCGSSGSSVELPEADIWKDPCIEFAIKTLTGSMPVGFDQTEEDQSKSQQPTSSVTTQVSMTTKQSDCDYLCQHFNLTHKAAPGAAFLPLSRLGHQNP